MEEQKAARAAKVRARLREARKNPDAVIVGGRNVFIRKTVTGTCQECPTEFSYVMTTKSRKYCPGCAATRERRRLATRKPKTKTVATVSIFRYAGYDPTEVQE